MALDTETLTLLLDAVRRFVHERLIPAEDELAASGQVPPDIVTEMRELGLFGLSISPDHGGLGLTMEEEVKVVFELGQTSPAFRSLAGTNIGIGSQAIVLAGTDEQRARYLPRLASGELIGSFALTEPDAGSDAMALRLAAERDGDHYVLNGTKRYITNAPIAGLFSVMARTAPERRAFHAASAAHHADGAETAFMGVRIAHGEQGRQVVAADLAGEGGSGGVHRRLRRRGRKAARFGAL